MDTDTRRATIRKILVVDGEVEITKTMIRHLRREGFQMGSSNTIRGARQKIIDAARQGDDFDLVISDLTMSGNGGLDFVEWLKSNYPEISILLISGIGGVDLLAGAIRPELDTYCFKPLTPGEMMLLVTIIGCKRQSINNW